MKATAVNLRGLKREPRNIRIGNWLFKSVDLVIKLVWGSQKSVLDPGPLQDEGRQVGVNSQTHSGEIAKLQNGLQMQAFYA